MQFSTSDRYLISESSEEDFVVASRMMSLMCGYTLSEELEPGAEDGAEDGEGVMPFPLGSAHPPRLVVVVVVEWLGKEEEVSYAAMASEGRDYRNFMAYSTPTKSLLVVQAGS